MADIYYNGDINTNDPTQLAAYFTDGNYTQTVGALPGADDTLYIGGGTAPLEGFSNAFITLAALAEASGLSWVNDPVNSSGYFSGVGVAGEVNFPDEGWDGTAGDNCIIGIGMSAGASVGNYATWNVNSSQDNPTYGSFGTHATITDEAWAITFYGDVGDYATITGPPNTGEDFIIYGSVGNFAALYADIEFSSGASCGTHLDASTALLETAGANIGDYAMIGQYNDAVGSGGSLGNNSTILNSATYPTSVNYGDLINGYAYTWGTDMDWDGGTLDGATITISDSFLLSNGSGALSTNDTHFITPTLPPADKVQSGYAYGVGGDGNTGTLAGGGGGVFIPVPALGMFLEPIRITPFEPI